MFVIIDLNLKHKGAVMINEKYPTFQWSLQVDDIIGTWKILYDENN
jgi:hypothetical protein